MLQAQAGSQATPQLTGLGSSTSATPQLTGLGSATSVSGVTPVPQAQAASPLLTGQGDGSGSNPGLQAHVQSNNSTETSVFDPTSSTTLTKHTFVAPDEVNKYVETHFRRVLTDEQRPG